MTDADLIDRFQKGDRAAFDALVALYLPRIVGLARRLLSDAHEALDVSQEVFIAAYQILPRWRPEAEFFTWLYRTAVNLCLKRNRARAREAPSRSSVVPPEDVGRADLAEALESALSKLSDRQREVFVLCHEQGVSLVEISSRLGLSVGTVKSHLHRALAQLRDDLRLKGLC